MDTDIENNMQSEKIKNEMVDEVINLQEPEEVNQEQKLKNQPVDEVHMISSNSQDDHIPSQDDSQDQAMDTKDDDHLLHSQANPATKWDGYNPADYENLQIDPDIKNLFSYISDYNPEQIEIDTFLKPFIPDYIPAIGEVDAFLKLPRPDGQPDKLGLSVIDEPKLNQSSEPVIREMLKQRGLLRQTDYKDVSSLENAHKNPKDIANWVQNMDTIAKGKEAQTVIYQGKMPDINDLMQAWDPSFERAIRGIDIPDNMDIPIEDYVKFACGLLDIPINKEAKDNNLIEAMHMMFKLYDGFQSNMYFNQNQNEVV